MQRIEAHPIIDLSKTSLALDPRNQLLNPENVDLEVLYHAVGPHVAPVPKPTAMVVGIIASIKEGLAVRAFLSKTCGCPPHDATVIGCTNIGSGDGASLRQAHRLDCVRLGSRCGDATRSETWIQPLLQLGHSMAGYDFVYIRNPNLSDLPAWSGAFARAHEFLNPGGLIATLIRADDLESFGRLLDRLRLEPGIEPFKVGPTGLPADSWGSEQYNTLAIFRKAAPRPKGGHLLNA